MRIAAYCRVSTDKTDQLNSLEAQKKFFYEYAGAHLRRRRHFRYKNQKTCGVFTHDGGRRARIIRAGTGQGYPPFEKSNNHAIS